MSDDLHLVQVCKENDELLIDGGEAGGKSAPKMILKRSEILALRRFSDRFGIDAQERRGTAEAMLDIVKKSKSNRQKIGAAKVIVSMDKVNLDEIKIAIGATQVAGRIDEKSSNGVQVNVQIVEQVMTKADINKEKSIAPEIAVHISEEVVDVNGSISKPA